jgi:hypothetical protein
MAYLIPFFRAGGIVTFLGSELLHKSLRNDDGKGLVGKMDDSLGHLEKFTSDTINVGTSIIFLNPSP